MSSGLCPGAEASECLHSTVLRPVHLCRAPISDEAIAALHASVGRVATLTPADCHRILVALVDWYERENEQATDAPLNVEALAIFAYNEGRCSR